MTATTYTVPTLLLALPLMAAFLALHVWSWHRYVAPRVGRWVYGWALKALMREGLTIGQAQTEIDRWRAEASTQASKG